MTSSFRNRVEAGRALAKKLARYTHRPDVLILALPRGGVPVGREVARALHAPLDVFLVRKLGVPGHEELAMGAIATGGVQVLNEEVVKSLNIPNHAIAAAAAREQRELERRERAYRGNRPAPSVAGRTVIVIDDGIATGSTMLAAVEALRRQRPARIVIATPVAARDTAAKLGRVADEFIAVLTPVDFSGVGQWYDDFSQTTDEEVRLCLRVAEQIQAENRGEV
ncbi:MAG: phosphoribosyltransferase [Verrucomicrobia bacterium]|nr:phosphoribosyltransferase [Verrucomicrobiota bacterium]